MNRARCAALALFSLHRISACPATTQVHIHRGQSLVSQEPVTPNSSPKPFPILSRSHQLSTFSFHGVPIDANLATLPLRFAAVTESFTPDKRHFKGPSRHFRAIIRGGRKYHLSRDLLHGVNCSLPAVIRRGTVPLLPSMNGRNIVTAAPFVQA